jgi:hypothetical protein
MFLKKTMDMYLIVIIILCGVSLGMNYITLTRFDDVAVQLKSMQSQLASILSELGM